MKKFIPKLLLLAGVAITVAACSKKDSAPTSDIVGKWSVKSDTTRVYDDKGTLVETDVNSDIQPTDFAQFNQDGTGTEHEYGFVVDFKYTFNNSTLTFTYTGSNIQGATGVGIDVATVKHLDAHSLYTIQTSPDTLGNVIYQEKESLHFSK